MRESIFPPPPLSLWEIFFFFFCFSTYLAAPPLFFWCFGYSLPFPPPLGKMQHPEDWCLSLSLNSDVPAKTLGFPFFPFSPLCAELAHQDFGLPSPPGSPPLFPPWWCFEKKKLFPVSPPFFPLSLGLRITVRRRAWIAAIRGG